MCLCLKRYTKSAVRAAEAQALSARNLQERRPVGDVQDEKGKRKEEAGKFVDAKGRFAPVAERVVLRNVRRAVRLVVAVLVVEVDRLRQVLVGEALHHLGRDRAHVVVHDGKLHQREKHKHRTGRHPHVDGFHVRNGRQRLLGLGVLGGQRQQRGHAERNARRNRLRLDPERDPRHDDDQRRRDVRVEEMVAEAPPQVEHHRQAGEVPRRVLDRAVRRVVV